MNTPPTFRTRPEAADVALRLDAVNGYLATAPAYGPHRERFLMAMAAETERGEGC